MATVILDIPEDRVSQKELFERLKNLPRIDLGMSGADLVREAREEHDREIDEWLSHR